MEQIEGYYSPSSSGVTIQETASIVWRRKWVALTVFLIVVGFGYRFVRLRKPVWTATSQMMLTARGTTPTSGDLNTQMLQLETPETNIALLEQDEMADRTRKRLIEEARAIGVSASDLGVTDPAMFRLDFAGAVKVVNPPDTSVLEVSVTSDNPERAKIWANAVCYAFVDFKKTLAGSTISGIVADLQVHVKQAKEKLDKAEQAEADFKRRNNVVDFGMEQKALADKSALVETTLETARQDLATQQVNLNKIISQIDEMEHNLNQTHQVADPLHVAQLQSDLQKLLTQKQVLQQKYRDTYPGIFDQINEEIRKTRADLAAEMKATANNTSVPLQRLGELRDQRVAGERLIAAQTRRIADLTAQFADLKQKRSRMPQQNLEYSTLQHDSALALVNYNNFQAQLNKALIEKPTATGNVMISQEARTPVVPSSLPAGRILLVFVLFGAFLGVAAALVFDRGDKRVRSVERVRALVSGPIVGTLPRLNPMQMRRMIAGETPPIAAEAYSLACANLMLALRHAWQDDLWHRQLVLITSAVPNEGKSITAAEVARFMARSGKSVILVDADMRRPTQRRLFNIDGEFGLADALVGDKQVADLMLDTDEPNLRLLPSGIVKKNPTALMSSPRLAETMNQLRELADVVIVDAPACAVVADAMLVAPLVDCIIQVVGAGVVSEKLVSETTEALRAAAPRTFAFIVNRAPNDRSRVYTPYYFKEYRGAANGNGHTSNDRGAYALPGVSNEEPQAPTSVAASNGANGANGAHTNGHSDHERIVIALPEDAGPTGTAPATDRSGSAS